MRAKTQGRIGFLALACLLPHALGYDSDDAVSSDLEVSDSEAQIPIGTIYHKKDIELSDLVDGDDGKYSYTLQDTRALVISLHIDKARLPAYCHLDISDGEGEQSKRFYGNADDLWGHEVFGDTAKIVVQCPKKLYDRAELHIDEYAVFYPYTSRENICGVDDTRNAVCYKDDKHNEYTAAQAVARLRFPGGACTGWLVKSTHKNMFITNNHCIASNDVALKAKLDFDYEEPDCKTSKKIKKIIPTVVEPKTLVFTDIGLDFTLIELKVTPGEDTPGDVFGELPLANKLVPVAGERLYIPQHPSGGPKRLGIKDTHEAVNGDCKVMELGNNDKFLYTCDTRPGSSGSPVLNNDNEVIGLHREGGDCSGNGAIQVIAFHDMITPYLNGWKSGDKCAPGHHKDDTEVQASCKECFGRNCVVNECVGSEMEHQRCTVCENGYKVANNGYGGKWCEVDCTHGTYYDLNEGECETCPKVENCVENKNACVGPNNKDQRCSICEDGYVVAVKSDGGHWCKRITNCNTGKYYNLDTGACATCPENRNCVENACLGSSNGNQRCNKCKTGYGLARNSDGGQWCKLNPCNPGTYKHKRKNKKNKCKKCPRINNCKEVRCTDRNHRWCESM